MAFLRRAAQIGEHVRQHQPRLVALHRGIDDAAELAVHGFLQFGFVAAQLLHHVGLLLFQGREFFRLVADHDEGAGHVADLVLAVGSGQFHREVALADAAHRPGESADRAGDTARQHHADQYREYRDAADQEEHLAAAFAHVIGIDLSVHRQLDHAEGLTRVVGDGAPP